MTRNKSIAKSKIKLGHPINSVKELSADNSRIIFTFYNVDRDGDFAFNPARKDFDSKLFVEKLISYSSMTWRESIYFLLAQKLLKEKRVLARLYHL